MTLYVTYNIAQDLYFYRVVGSALIVLGLYGVLWGKKEEANCTHMVEEEVYNF